MARRKTTTLCRTQFHAARQRRLRSVFAKKNGEDDAAAAAVAAAFAAAPLAPRRQSQTDAVAAVVAAAAKMEWSNRLRCRHAHGWPVVVVVFAVAGID